MSRRMPTLTVPQTANIPVNDIPAPEWLPVREESALSRTRTYDVRAFDADGAVTGDGLRGAVAAAAANGGGVVTLPPGHHHIDKGVQLQDNVHLVAPGAILDFSAMDYAYRIEQSCIYASGSYDQLPGLAAGVSQWSQSITLSGPHGLDIGDLVMIHDETPGGFLNSRPSYQQGEFLRVMATPDATTVQFESRTFGEYPLANPVNVYKIVPVRTSLRGVRVIGRPSARPVYFDWTDGARISDCEFTGPSEHSQFWLSHSYDTVISNTRTHATTDGATTTQYGIIIGNSQKVTVNGVHCETMRHGITTGGAPGVGAIPCRDVVIGDSIIGGHGIPPTLPVPVNGFSLHGNIEYVTISNCIFTNGVTLAGNHVTFVGNTVRMNNGQAPLLFGGESLGADYLIADNVFHAQNTPPDNGMAVIRFLPGTDTVRGGTVRILNNKINIGSYRSSVGSTTIVAARNVDAASSAISLDIRNNEISGNINFTAGENGFAIYIDCAAGQYFENVLVRDNTVRRGGSIRLTTMNFRRIDVRGNVVHNPPLEGIRVDGQGVTLDISRHVTVAGNQVYRAGQTPISVTNLDGAVAIVRDNDIIDGNDVQSGSSTAGAAILMGTMARAIIDGNTIQNGTGRLTSRIALSSIGYVNQSDTDSYNINQTNDNASGVTEYYINEAGVGAPSINASNGSTYLNRTGSAGSTFFVREGGAWVAK